jgi:hypothetical protein
MKVITINYKYYGHTITQSIDLVEIISQLPDAIKIETVLDIMQVLTGKEHLHDWQIAVLREKHELLKKALWTK